MGQDDQWDGGEAMKDLAMNCEHCGHDRDCHAISHERRQRDLSNEDQQKRQQQQIKTKQWWHKIERGAEGRMHAKLFSAPATVSHEHLRKSLEIRSRPAM